LIFLFQLFYLMTVRPRLCAAEIFAKAGMPPLVAIEK